MRDEIFSKISHHAQHKITAKMCTKGATNPSEEISHLNALVATASTVLLGFNTFHL